MDFAVFRCCPTSIFLKQYESSTDALLKGLDVTCRDIKEFNCCGYPLKNLNLEAYILSSARNLSIAEKRGVNILTLCNCCYGSLKHAQQLLEENRSLREEVDRTLEKESLAYRNEVRVRHVLEVLFEDIGIEAIKERIRRPFRNLKIATHYGCHLLRPSQTVQFDSPMFPNIFDQLVEITGAESVDWRTQLDCCGSPVWGIYDDLSKELTEKKVMDARESGAEFLCVACVYCHLQFDRVQKMFQSTDEKNHYLPTILYPQLLGLTLGIDPGVLGIDQNALDCSGIMSNLT